MAEFLLELRSEEIPARMQATASADLKRLVISGLNEAGLIHETVDCFATPRRLTVVVEGLPTEQPDTREERKGPKTDAPEKAIEGFLKSVGLTRDQVEERETPKGNVLFAVIEKQGRASIDVLGEICAASCAALPWAKSMKWGNGSIRWVRPLQSILALFDGAVVPVEYAGITSSDKTAGHRFHAPDYFAVQNFADYREKLFEASVILESAERQDLIRAGADKQAAEEGLTVQTDDALLREVAGLVEWPVPLMGKIDEEFMEVPREVLTASMRAHQKYFSLDTADGDLAPRFIVVANLKADDGGKAIIAGNERVLRARLADAKFFWDQDRKSSLDSLLPALEKIVFHAKLGTVAERVHRVQNLAGGIIADAVSRSLELTEPQAGELADKARMAARLAKADLASGMVAEFPELQGLMGRYYAMADGEPADVAQAIADHYSPQGPNDTCPSAPVSVAVALADKLDTLVGFFAIDEKPTGSKDPFALRRAALGIIRLILQNNLRLNLRDAIVQSLELYANELPDKINGNQVALDLMAFIADRLKVHLKDKNIRHDRIDAALSAFDDGDLVKLVKKVSALNIFLATEDGANILSAYKRANNIVRAAEKEDKVSYKGAATDEHLSLTEEYALFEALITCGSELKNPLILEDYTSVMTSIAKLRGPVDAFLDNVTVNTTETAVRVNRLMLLAYIRTAVSKVADFSKLEG
ncbi:MAG: glycine--tRNA ligase subunit beta [Alphaproteobacteria bacterium]|jgi:glycyl-tRNA synthetase beta chain|nr:glycine--tRNA ligase subunit beta [Alphaproteobacteria bacterium]MBT4086102.1 glycine--tRNA ligase subunit beta [Alphaproteobacteria bacterium]MBT4543719.1 glycine--tRNA ligase subunit beta [Alphaproteobacteria bacterium]MBT6386547.1 glycine--tRNA ligase subunit beta [Alphaproteobacteria bacterium]MBT7743964.1 glycine--tRNA ligase subunit beta [Alphaproteobacteria bacterium]